MVRKFLFASALLALGLALPVSARAQEMGGGSNADDSPKPADSPAPKPADSPAPAPKPADSPAPAPKPADTKKTLSFDAPSSWTTGRGGKGGKGNAGGGGPRGGHFYTIKATDGDTDDAHATLVQPKNAKDFDGELSGWLRQFETADGKKLDKSAAKTDSLDTGAGTAKTAEFSGTFVMQPRRGKNNSGGDAAAPTKKPGWKSISALLQGPDGVWIARITGPEKTVDAAKDDFVKWVKSAKVVDGAAAPAAPAGGGKPSAGGDKPAAGGEKDD